MLQQELVHRIVEYFQVFGVIAARWHMTYLHAGDEIVARPLGSLILQFSPDIKSNAA